MLNTAILAAREGGRIIARYVDRVDTVAVAEKSRNDFVSEVDRQAEAEITAVIRKAYPQHGILGEEGGRSGGDEFVWIVDPLDGTTNFLHGFPQFSVSIACEHRGRIEVAVVFDPLRSEMFTASRGSGTQLDGRRVRVSRQRTLEGSLIGTGFPYRANIKYAKPYLAMLEVVMGAAAGIRRPGSAALDLAYVAAGRTDGFWEIGLAPWDTAAGTLLITEAGGMIGTLTGARYEQGGNVVAGNPKVYAALLEAIRPHVPEDLEST
jgi:myo-inositol-1(or 4)-monophosphatase